MNGKGALVENKQQTVQEWWERRLHTTALVMHQDATYSMGVVSNSLCIQFTLLTFLGQCSKSVW